MLRIGSTALDSHMVKLFVLSAVGVGLRTSVMLGMAFGCRLVCIYRGLAGYIINITIIIAHFSAAKISTPTACNK